MDKEKTKERPSGSRVVNVNWNPDNRKLNVNANDPDNVNDNLGGRFSRSFLAGFEILNPAAEHLADLLQAFFGFEIFLVFNNLKVKRQPIKYFKYFYFSVCFNKISIFEVLWL